MEHFQIEITKWKKMNTYEHISKSFVRNSNVESPIES